MSFTYMSILWWGVWRYSIVVSYFDYYVLWWVLQVPLRSFFTFCSQGYWLCVQIRNSSAIMRRRQSRSWVQYILPSQIHFYGWSITDLLKAFGYDKWTWCKRGLPTALQHWQNLLTSCGGFAKLQWREWEEEANRPLEEEENLFWSMRVNLVIKGR